MGEGKPACSSKQALHAFEDVLLLQANVGMEDKMHPLSDVLSLTATLMHSQWNGNRDLLTVLIPNFCLATCTRN